jgi:hypothetical protein
VTAPTIVTPAELDALRARYANLRLAGGLMGELGRAGAAAELFREAGDLIAATYAVEHQCLLCPALVPVERPLDGPPTVIEAVVCGAHYNTGETATVLLS